MERFSLARIRYDRRSFVVFGWDAAYQLESGRRKLVQQKPTDLENYMVGRLQGAASGTWLDTIPFSEAVRLCGAFGQLTDGKLERAAKAIAPDEGDRLTYDAGFQMLSRDPQSITVFLDSSFIKQKEKVTAVAVERMLGPYLSSILEGHRKETTGFSVFRETVLAFIKHHRGEFNSERSPQSLRRKPRRKKALTVADAAVRFALPADVIQLFASDAVQPFDSSGGLTDAAIKSIRSRRRALLSMEEVRGALAIPNGGVWRLADAGLLCTVFRGPHGNLARKFDPGAVSSLLRRLEGAASAVSADTNWLTPNEAGKKYQCGLETVVQILLSGNMQRVFYRSTETGLNAFLFCEREFFTKLTDVKWFGITVQQACKRLGISYVAITGLVRLGFLDHFQFRQGTGNIAYISESSLVAFQNRYMTAAAVAAVHGRHSSAMIRDLEKRGIRPDIRRSMAGANFYLRERFGL